MELTTEQLKQQVAELEQKLRKSEESRRQAQESMEVLRERCRRELLNKNLEVSSHIRNIVELEKDKARLEAVFGYLGDGGALIVRDGLVFTFHCASSSGNIKGCGCTERQALDRAIAKAGLPPEHISQSGETLKGRGE